MPHSDPQRRVALMLCESLFHVLVEEGVLTKAKAMEAIEGVVELTREMGRSDPPPNRIGTRTSSSDSGVNCMSFATSGFCARFSSLAMSPSIQPKSA